MFYMKIYQILVLNPILWSKKYWVTWSPLKKAIFDENSFRLAQNLILYMKIYNNLSTMIWVLTWMVRWKIIVGHKQWRSDNQKWRWVFENRVGIFTKIRKNPQNFKDFVDFKTFSWWARWAKWAPIYAPGHKVTP